MKKFLRKRWHSIPVALVAVLLAVALVSGGVLAANGYGFFTAAVSVEVEEAIAVGTWYTWDNLEPYGSVDDVDITIVEGNGNPTFAIATKGTAKYVGEGFAAGEYIVIPLNIRNGGDGPLNLEASVSAGGGGLVLEYCWRENGGPVSDWGPEDQPLCREFKDNGTWQPLDSWTATIAGNGGKSGSAIVGAQVLFVRISAPGNMVPGTYAFTVTLERS